jgi:hypothetical protein
MKAKFTRGTDHRLGIRFEPEIFEEQLLLESFARWSEGREFRFSSYEQNHPGRTMREGLTSCWGELVEPAKPEPEPAKPESLGSGAGPKIKSGSELDWQAAQDAAHRMLKVADSASYVPPEAIGDHMAYVRRVCVALDEIVIALKLRAVSAAEGVGLMGESDRLRALLAETLDRWERWTKDRGTSAPPSALQDPIRIREIRSEAGIEGRKL